MVCSIKILKIALNSWKRIDKRELRRENNFNYREYDNTRNLSNVIKISGSFFNSFSAWGNFSPKKTWGNWPVKKKERPQ